MKEDLIKELIEIIKGTKDFALAQAPDVYRNIIVSSIIHKIFIVLQSALCIVVIFLLLKSLNKMKEEDWPGCDVKFGQAFGTVLGIIALFIGFLIACQNLQELVQIYAAPKAYLLEYLRVPPK